MTIHASEWSDLYLTDFSNLAGVSSTSVRIWSGRRNCSFIAATQLIDMLMAKSMSWLKDIKTDQIASGSMLLLKTWPTALYWS